MSLKQVYLAENVIDAQLLCDMLIEAGFEARVFGGFLTGATGEIPPDGLIKVMVNFPHDNSGDGQSPDSSLSVGKWYFPQTPDVGKDSIEPAGTAGQPGEVESDEPKGFETARRIVEEFEAARSQEAWPRVCKQCGEDTNSRFSHCWCCGAPIDS